MYAGSIHGHLDGSLQSGHACVAKSNINFAPASPTHPAITSPSLLHEETDTSPANTVDQFPFLIKAVCYRKF